MDNFAFILVRPEYAGNIGQAARAMANFGFNKLAVVAPKKLPTHREAMQYAMKAQPILEKAQVAKTLVEVVADRNFLIGTSRRFGKFRGEFVPVRDIAKVVRQAGAGAKIGVLFGSEIKGLTNDELAMCQTVVTITTHPQCPSINLAHSVALVAYELANALSNVPARTSRRAPIKLATQDLIEGMYGKFEDVLEAIGFFKYGSRKKVMREIHHLFGRTTLTFHEAQMLWAIWEKILRYRACVP